MTHTDVEMIVHVEGALMCNDLCQAAHMNMFNVICGEGWGANHNELICNYFVFRKRDYMKKVKRKEKKSHIFSSLCCGCWKAPVDAEYFSQRRCERRNWQTGDFVHFHLPLRCPLL